MKLGSFPSLYLHFPFCETKCHYCDFYSIGAEKTKAQDAPTFEKALIQEIKLRLKDQSLIPATPIDTIFLGGGTPSMTPPESMERIFKTLLHSPSSPRLANGYEWTMEANPSSIELQQFQAYREIGINRVSMGVQSLKDSHLKTLGRVHNESAALKALDTLFAAGFENVSTDLLCGVPGQTLADLEDHLTRLTAFPIQHLSIYLLTLPPHHKMFQDLPDEDEQLRHLLFIDEFMNSAGFEHYEISNFAKPGKQARHNLHYWTGGSYLGFGPSAHSYNAETSERFKNYSSLHRYANELVELEKLPVEWTESLTPEQLDLEKWMLAIRLNRGFPSTWLARSEQKQKAEFFTQEKLLETHPERSGFLRATPRGFALSDHLIQGLS